MANIRDVAAVAGVSRSTVSLVLNNSPLVKTETRDHVLRVIEQMNYVPNNNARSLSNKVMNSLAVIILSEQKDPEGLDYSHSSGYHSSTILRGITDRLMDTDYGVMVEYYDYQASGKELPKLIQNRRVDGAFLIGSLYNQELIERIKSAGIPLCMAGIGLKDTQCDSVYADPEEGVFMILKYLMEEGHQNICFINCPETYVSYQGRLNGIERSVKELGLNFNWDLLVDAESNSGEGGYKAMKQIWERGHRPDGVVTANAMIALGAMRYLYEKNIRIPDEISVATYEDNSLCMYATPALTAVNIQKEQLGRTVANMMLERLAEPDKPWETYKGPSWLVKRDSVKRRIP